MDFFPAKVNTDSPAVIRALLANPTRIERRINEMSADRFLVDYVFARTTAEGGSVLYDRDDEGQYLARDAEAIDAGGEFPKLGGEEVLPHVARVSKYGGEVDLSFESVRRGDTADYRRKVTQLANTVVRKTNLVGVEAIRRDADIQTAEITTPWTEAAADPITDLMAAVSQIDDAELGYETNTVLINPQDVLVLRQREDIRDALPRENPDLNPLLSKELAGLLSLDWIKSSFVPRGTAWIVDRNNLGSVGDEEGGVRADTYDEKHRQVHVLQAWRSVVPVITNPRAAIKLEGFVS